MIDLAQLEYLLEDSGALYLEPRATFDRAIVGLACRMNMTVLAYDRELVIDALVQVDGMDEDDAEEYYEFNIAGSWLGEGTPVFIDRLLPDCGDE
ncbi:MAG: hypothetical protein ACXWVD_00175 [Telluria sp.]